MKSANVNMGLTVIFLITVLSCAPHSDRGAVLSSVEDLKNSENAIVIRASFSDDAKWMELREEILRPSEPHGFLAYVDFFENEDLIEKGKKEIVDFISEVYDHGFIIIANEETFIHPENPVLVVDLESGGLDEFQSIPEQVQAIENNLSVSNMGFDEFTGAVGLDGVFRGFLE